MRGLSALARAEGVALLLALIVPEAGQAAEPPDAPAALVWEGASLRLEYEGLGLLSARVEAKGPVRLRSQVERTGGALTQVIALTSDSPTEPLRLLGEVLGSDEAFPCEADPRPSGLDVVRHASGLGWSRLNRAVYDRKRDWALSVDIGPEVRVRSAGEASGQRRFTLEALGSEIVLRLRPRFFQKHRGLSFFEPWNYEPWPHPVAGWSSWFAYKTEIDEGKVLRMAGVLAETLRPFGLEYLQIDDGFQRDAGAPENWLNPNPRFPSGLAALAREIAAKGLRPAIWTNVANDQGAYVEAHPDWFVADERGRPARGRWIGYPLDGSNPAAVDALIRPLYGPLREMGWAYFKLDALRHLRYEGYNAYADFFARKGADRVAAFRAVVRAVREEIGPDRFLLACWGIRPELVGLVDGCRIGDDGFGFAGLAQYNSFNNVVWRNDPDHIELTPREAWRSSMVTSLTGSLFMVTDKPEVYRTDLVEAARRTLPVLLTVPGQLYDVDPSRSGLLGRVDTEVSGSGPRPFDAGYAPRVHLYALEVSRPFEDWLVLGRTGGHFDAISFADLGLPDQEDQFVFEFWTKRLIGRFRGSFSPGEPDPRFHAQAFCIRRALDRPQVLATSRHVSCGGLELRSLSWTGSALEGESELVAGDPYDLYLAVPEGHRLAEVEAPGAQTLAIDREKGLAVVHLRSARGGLVSWKAAFEVKAAPPR